MAENGDKNSKYFHATAQWHARSNKIHILKNEGQTVTLKLEKKLVCWNFYNNLFSNTNTVVDADLIIPSHLPNVLDGDDNLALLKTPSEEEVRNAVFAINKDKAPGPDGFNAKFFQGFWHDIKGDIVQFAKDFFENNSLDLKVNLTTIALIPKRQGAVNVSDYRPISLCNIQYKIISKISVERIRRLLQEFISDNQGAFMPGRRANDNVVIAKKMVHMMFKKSRKRHMCH